MKPVRLDDFGDVLFLEDLCAVLGTSRDTIERRRRVGNFPIPELPAIGIGRRARPRWSRESVRRFLDGESARRGPSLRRVG